MSGTLSEVFLLVSDTEASANFYSRIVGLDVERAENTVRFDTGQSTLVLQEDFSQEVLDEYGLEQPEEPRGGGVTIVIDVSDPDVVYDRATDDGCEVLTEPRNVEWGRRMCLLRDPDGYVLEVSKPIGDGES